MSLAEVQGVEGPSQGLVRPEIGVITIANINLLKLQTGEGWSPSATSRMVGVDTQADGSVTNIRELLGDLDPRASFRIRDWSGDTTGKQYLAGENEFLGRMVYSEDCDGTLLAYCDLLKSFHVRWTADGSVAEATHKKTPRITLRFQLNCKGGQTNTRSKVLMADASAVWQWLVRPEEELTLRAAAVGITPLMNKRELTLAMEVNRFHMFVHPSDSSLKDMVKKSCLSGIPFWMADIDNAAVLRGKSDCIACIMAKISLSSRQVVGRGPTIGRGTVLPTVEELG